MLSGGRLYQYGGVEDSMVGMSGVYQTHLKAKFGDHLRRLRRLEERLEDLQHSKEDNRCSVPTADQHLLVSQHSVCAANAVSLHAMHIGQNTAPPEQHLLHASFSTPVDRIFRETIQAEAENSSSALSSARGECSSSQHSPAVAFPRADDLGRLATVLEAMAERISELDHSLQSLQLEDSKVSQGQAETAEHRWPLPPLSVQSLAQPNCVGWQVEDLEAESRQPPPRYQDGETSLSEEARSAEQPPAWAAEFLEGLREVRALAARHVDERRTASDGDHLAMVSSRTVHTQVCSTELDGAATPAVHDFLNLPPFHSAGLLSLPSTARHSPMHGPSSSPVVFSRESPQVEARPIMDDRSPQIETRPIMQPTGFAVAITEGDTTAFEALSRVMPQPRDPRALRTWRTLHHASDPGSAVNRSGQWLSATQAYHASPLRVEGERVGGLVDASCSAFAAPSSPAPIVRPEASIWSHNLNPVRSAGTGLARMPRDAPHRDLGLPGMSSGSSTSAPGFHVASQLPSSAISVAACSQDEGQPSQRPFQAAFSQDGGGQAWHRQPPESSSSVSHTPRKPQRTFTSLEQRHASDHHVPDQQLLAELARAK
eukprot:TRINITY_DN100930_c0_g1_i1.p1 TRINITY_DN100930_c0_g1~~TRINITY_DN100930_c0_g1_i1.p1  ORF type:complete len:599 (-),score=39.46 TRINITY_DN100930_c0_g1_i1:401-2197(-)